MSYLPCFFLNNSSGASRGGPHGVGSLKVRKGTFDALKKGLEHVEKWSKLTTPSGAPPEELHEQ